MNPLDRILAVLKKQEDELGPLQSVLIFPRGNATAFYLRGRIKFENTDELAALIEPQALPAEACEVCGQVH